MGCAVLLVALYLLTTPYAPLGLLLLILLILDGGNDGGQRRS